MSGQQIEYIRVSTVDQSAFSCSMSSKLVFLRGANFEVYSPNGADLSAN